MNTAGNRAVYDEIADWYHQATQENSLLHAALLSSTLQMFTGPLDSRSICDLGCGQGILSRFMAQQGAVITGIDISERLLDYARHEEAAKPFGIVYCHEDAQTLITIDDATFDGVVCAMALMDILDLDATLQTVRRILKPDGWFVFIITHPCFQSPPDSGYYAEGFWRSENSNGVRGKVGAYHHTLSTYLNAITKANLFPVRFAEPPLPGRNVPTLLWVRCECSQETT